MKIIDILATTLAKKGVGGYLKNFRTEVEIPNTDPAKKPIKLIISADLLRITVEKE